MTARWHTREQLLHQTVILAGQGVSRRALARALGVSRNTIKALLKEHERSQATAHTALPAPPRRAPRSSPVDAFDARIVALLAQYEDITAQRVFEILREEGFVGGHTAIKKRVRMYRCTVRFETRMPIFKSSRRIRSAPQRRFRFIMSLMIGACEVG